MNLHLTQLQTNNFRGENDHPMMSKGGKEITLPLRDVSGRMWLWMGEEKAVQIWSNNLASFVERKVDSVWTNHHSSCPIN